MSTSLARSPRQDRMQANASAHGQPCRAAGPRKPRESSSAMHPDSSRRPPPRHAAERNVRARGRAPGSIGSDSNERTAASKAADRELRGRNPARGSYQRGRPARSPAARAVRPCSALGCEARERTEDLEANVACAAQGPNLRALKRGGAGREGLWAGPGRCAGAASLLLRSGTLAAHHRRPALRGSSRSNQTQS
jgi:hypothetical protein